MSTDEAFHPAWADTRATLQGLFETAPAEGVAHWLRAFATAYVAGDVESCDRLAGEAFAFPPELAGSLRSHFQPAAAALRSGAASEARERLTIDAIDRIASLRTVLDATVPEDLRSGVDSGKVDALAGCWLELAGSPAAAAQSYREAGTRLVGASDALTAAAADLLARSAALAPAAVTYWYLADAWRIRSYTTTPPYVDRGPLESGLDAWTKGAALQAPDRSTSWSYVVRALIGEQLARLDEPQRTAYWWDAVLYLERAILLDDADAGRWAYLGRYHRFLENDATALQATAAALERQPDDQVALEERAAILTNIGAFDQARAALDARLQVDPENAWALSVKAYVLTRQRDYQTALALIDKVIAVEPDNIWSLDVRATCCRMLGDAAGARDAYLLTRRIGASTPSLATDDKRHHAFACYQLGEIDEAIAILTPLSEDPLASDDAWRLLGLCYFVKGEVARAEELLLRGVTRGTARELDDFLAFELPDLEMHQAGAAVARERVVALARIRATATALLAERRVTAIEDPRAAAEAELRSIIRSADTASASASPAARAGLARLQLSGERWSEAATTYRELQSTTVTVPERALGAERAVEGLGRVARQLLHDGKVGEAMEQFRQLLSLAADLGGSGGLARAHQDLAGALWSAGQLDEAAAHFESAIALTAHESAAWQADLHSRLGFAQQRRGDQAGARQNYARALAFFRTAGEVPPGEALAACCVEMLRTVDEFWMVDAEWGAFERDAAGDEEWRDEIVRARRSLVQYLDRQYHLSEHGDQDAASPRVAPIGLDVGAAIRPLVDPKSDLGRFIEVEIPAALQRVENSVGFPGLPGISVRLHWGDSERYIIKLDDTPVAAGRVHVGAKFCAEPGEPERGSAIVAAADPATGGRGSWYVNTLVKSETEFMLAHVETMLRQHLDVFATPERAARILREIAKQDAYAAFAARLLADEDLLLAFARVLRVLAKQRIPLNDWTAIVPVLDNGGLRDVDAAVLRLRHALQAHLPGNEEGARRIPLPAVWDDGASADGSPLRLAPAEAYRRLLEIRELLRPESGHVALVAPNERVRAAVSRLIEYEFPRVAVLTSGEVIQQEASPSAATESIAKHEART